MSAEAIVSLILGSLAGLLANLIVGYFFYQRSGRELRTEAAQLRQLVYVLAHALESAGAIRVTWDDKGRLNDFVVKTRSVPLEAAIGVVTVSQTPPAGPHAANR
jgi:hypothetical protein